MASAAVVSAPEVKDLPLHIFRPVDHVRSLLRNGVRVDGRGLEQSRPVKVADGVLQGKFIVGSSQVQLGGSSVMCAVSVMVGMPSVHNPKIGDTECNVDMTHLCVGDPSLPPKEGSKPAIATEIERTVSALFNRGNVFDLGQLCIMEGKFAFRLCINVTVLSHAGNLKDASILAAVAALRRTSIPAATVEGSTVTVDMSNRRALESKLVIPVTVGLLDDFCFVDPVVREEKVMDGSVTTILDAETFAVHYMSMDSASVSRSKLNEIIEISQRHAVACKIVLSQQ